MPISLDKISYPHFKNIVKILYTPETTFPEQHIRKMIIHHIA